ncbi:hypothetical protein MRX96_043205 [Rhipicephalus microplus]
MAGEDLKKAEERWGALENARSGGCYALPPSAPRRIGRWGREAHVVIKTEKERAFYPPRAAEALPSSQWWQQLWKWMEAAAPFPPLRRWLARRRRRRAFWRSQPASEINKKAKGSCGCLLDVAAAQSERRI